MVTVKEDVIEVPETPAEEENEETSTVQTETPIVEEVVDTVSEEKVEDVKDNK